MQKIKKHVIIPAAIIVLAVIASVTLGVFNKNVAKKVVDNVVPEVVVHQVKPVSKRFAVKVNGVVMARNQARLLPEVSGLVVRASKKWHNGGFFKEGETLLQIEKHQYESQVARAKASVAKAHSVYVQEQGQAYVAKKEWDRRQSTETNPAAKALALREPQLESANAQYQAALADLALAELSLKKTTIRAPFDGIIQKKVADKGQFVSTGQMLAEIHAVDYVEVRVPLTESNQYLIDLPQLTGSDHQSVTAIYDTTEGEKTLKGKFVRTEAVLDEMTKVLYGVIEIKDPYFLSTETGSQPLRIGSYVEVTIDGREIPNLYSLPEKSLRRGNKVWVVTAESILKSVDVKLLSNYQGEVIAYQGVDENMQIVVGSVGKAMEGRVVSIHEQKPEKKDSSEPKSIDTLDSVLEP